NRGLLQSVHPETESRGTRLYLAVQIVARYFSGKGSAFNDPSRCLSKICTLLSALSSSCLHCAERRMPSSNILIESSSGKSPRSSWATIPSNCFSDSSNVANPGPLRLREHSLKNFDCAGIPPKR